MSKQEQKMKDDLVDSVDLEVILIKLVVYILV